MILCILYGERALKVYFIGQKINENKRSAFDIEKHAPYTARVFLIHCPLFNSRFHWTITLLSISQIVYLIKKAGLKASFLCFYTK